ncbi:MAG TPA: FlgD immunoglobulin-like domain containing protein, partial [Candidatus Limnocylindrales bacterium]
MKPMPRRLVAGFGAVALVASFATSAVAADPSTVTLTLDTPGTLQANHAFTLTAVVAPATAGFDTDATIEFVDANGSGDDCEVAVDPGNATSCTIDLAHAGDHSYTATYSGNLVLAGSVSDPPLEFTVVADTVDATGVGVNYGTFYPVKDNYRDTLKISGNRQEAIAVTIRIYNANDKRVARVTKSLASGGYSYSWNGKDGKKLLPAGKYRVVQTLVDGAGTTRTVTNNVNLSRKKLVTVTKTISKNGAAAGASSGNARKAGTAARLKAGANPALAAWQLKLPSAITYKSIMLRFQVAAHLSAPPSIIAMQNFNICTDWSATCFDRVKGIGNTSGSAKWYSTKGGPSAHRNGRVVRGLAGTAVGT